MGNAPKPRKKAKPPKLEPRRKPKTGNGAGGASVQGSDTQCWTFPIQGATAAARNAAAGTDVSGRAEGDLIIVMGNRVVFGSAPVITSRQITEALLKNHGRLAGKIISASNGSSYVTAKLCIN